MNTTQTDWLMVNSVKVRLVVECDEDGEKYVRLEADGGNLAGAAPGDYYPVPLEHIEQLAS